MSLFPLNDLIPNICATLSYSDIYSLRLVSRATCTELCTQSSTHQYDVHKEICSFRLIENHVAGVIMSTQTAWSLVRLSCTYTMSKLYYVGSEYTGLIRVCRFDNNARDSMVVRITYVKNNMATFFSEVVIMFGNVSSSALYECESAHYMDVINDMLIFSHFTDRFDDKFRASCNPLLQSFLEKYCKSDAENDVQLLQFFKQIN